MRGERRRRRRTECCFWVCITYGSGRSHHSCVRTIYNERPASWFDSTQRSAAHNHGRVFGDVGFIVCVFFSSLRIGDLQVAVRGLEPLPAHDLPLELVQGDVQPIESDCVVVQFGRKLIVNTRHVYRSKHFSQSSTRGEKKGGGEKKKTQAWYDNKRQQRQH